MSDTRNLTKLLPLGLLLVGACNRPESLSLCDVPTDGRISGRFETAGVLKTDHVHISGYFDDRCPDRRFTAYNNDLPPKRREQVSDYIRSFSDPDGFVEVPLSGHVIVDGIDDEDGDVAIRFVDIDTPSAQ